MILSELRENDVEDEHDDDDEMHEDIMVTEKLVHNSTTTMQLV